MNEVVIYSLNMTKNTPFDLNYFWEVSLYGLDIFRMIIDSLVIQAL